jgi:hypothetical protein
VEATGVDDETRQRDRRVVLRIRVRVGSALVTPQSSGAAAQQ